MIRPPTQIVPVVFLARRRKLGYAYAIESGRKQWDTQAFPEWGVMCCPFSCVVYIKDTLSSRTSDRCYWRGMTAFIDFGASIS